jgi:RNA polymerase sigma-70 factor (ECF subfamily)
MSQQRLSPNQFAERLTGSSRTLWCIAAGVLGSHARAEDVVQEAAVIALGKLQEFDPGSNFEAWMGQIVRYAALNERRRGFKHASADIEPQAAHPGVSNDAPDPIDAHGAIRPHQTSFDDDVLQALNALTETARTCLLLRTVLELSYKEIAEVLGIPEGTAMSHVHRSRKSMRETLRARGKEERGKEGAT